MSFFDHLDLAPDDPILSLPIAFAADPRSCKVNLGIGSYKTAEGKPLVLNCVKKAENLIVQKNLNKEYLAIEGDQEFLNYSQRLLFGPEYENIDPRRLFSAQTIGGSGALRIAAEFLAQNINRNIFLSQPSWTNHTPIFQHAGLSVKSYPYLNPDNHQIDFAKMCDAIKNMPSSSIIVFHGCCHNPTGLDPTFEQWQELARLVKKQRLVTLFDLAYQGFGQGLDQDAGAIRHFAKEGLEILVCYSFAKNFGIYGERVGFLSILANTPEVTPKVASQIKLLVRSNYSTPPLHGARIVKTILASPELTAEWQIELQNMRDRVKEMRIAFASKLLAKSSKENFSYIYQQNGLFSFCGLNSEQVARLRHEKGIYMPSNGRINIAGLNTENLDYVVDAILSV